MNRVYKWRRRWGFYDATRKYYLLGRDPLIAGLASMPRTAVRGRRHGARTILPYARGLLLTSPILRGRARIAIWGTQGLKPARQ